jgi:integrase
MADIDWLGDGAAVATMATGLSVLTATAVWCRKQFAELSLPPVEPQPVFFCEPDEAAALYAAAGDLDERWRTLVELGMQAGLRFEELAGPHGHRVDWLRGRLEVVDVMTRRGLRQWPKSRNSHRTVPVPAAVLEGMSLLMRNRDRTGLVFTAPDGGPVHYANFRNRVWYPAITAAGIRRFPPRVMRHTTASWLVQDGVPLYDVQAVLGRHDEGSDRPLAGADDGCSGGSRRRQRPGADD